MTLQKANESSTSQISTAIAVESKLTNFIHLIS